MVSESEPASAQFESTRECGCECRSDIGVLDADDAGVVAEDRLARMVTLDPGEIVILVVRPHALLLAASMLPTLFVLVVGLVLLLGLRVASNQLLMNLVLLFVGFGVIGVTVLGVLEYRARLYVLTDRRVVRRSGWSRVRHEQCALGDIREVGIEPEGASVRVGNLLMKSASGVQAWQYVADPTRVREIVMEAIDRYGRHEE
ncbi:MAG: hypothetical protein ACF8GE_10125 [Phycisphaerales bacterium JB043]